MNRRWIAAGIVAAEIMLAGCAAHHEGHGCMSTTDNWYKPDRTRSQTAQEMTDCRRGHATCSDVFFEDCMKGKGYVWVDGTENPRNVKPPESN